MTTEPHDLGSVRDALDGYGAKVLSAELTLVPQNTIPVDSETRGQEDPAADGRDRRPR